jgi:hypothetical protein
MKQIALMKCQGRQAAASLVGESEWRHGKVMITVHVCDPENFERGVNGGGGELVLFFYSE